MFLDLCGRPLRLARARRMLEAAPRVVAVGPCPRFSEGRAHDPQVSDCRLDQVRRAVRQIWNRYRGEVPGAGGEGPPTPSGRDQWLHRLERVRGTLERTRSVLEQQGWTSGAWFTVRAADGRPRRVTSTEALACRDPRREVLGSCLVGVLVRLAADPDEPTTLADLGGCVDELYEATHEQLGHCSFPPGRSRPPHERCGQVQALTAWNDAAGRTRADVLDLVDRAIARTILGSCA